MPRDRPNLLFIWTDQQARDTLGVYGNDRIETPHLDAVAHESAVFEHAYVSQPVCTPARGTVMTGQYPHETGVVCNNTPLARTDWCFPELGAFEDYRSCWIGKWHLGDEIYHQHGFDEWIATEDGYHPFYEAENDRSERSAYYHFLVDNGFEPDVTDEGQDHFSRGFAARLPEKYSKPHFMADRAIEFMEACGNEPFILHLMFLEPHPPYTSPRDDQYDPADVELPPNFEHDGMADQIDKVRFCRELVRRGIRHATRDPQLLSAPPQEPEWRELISNYWGLVSLVDTHVGRVLNAVQGAGMWDETITVFTSDHGDMMGSHQLFSKMVMFQEAIRVPLLLRLPGNPATGDRIDAPISQVDLVPTLLAAMNQPIPSDLHGQDWGPYLRGEAELEEPRVFVQWNGATAFGMHDRNSPKYPEWSQPRAEPEAEAIWNELFDRDIMRTMTTPVRTVITPDGWKLNYRRSGEHELYDLGTDPHETENLAWSTEHTAKIYSLYQHIVDWQRRTRDPVYL